MDIYTTIDKCRVCFSDSINEVLKLDPQYVATTLVKSNKNNNIRILVNLGN